MKKYGAYAEWIDIGPVLMLSPISSYIGILWSRPIQPDIVDVYRTCTTGCCAAFAAQADGDLINVAQVDALIGKSL